MKTKFKLSLLFIILLSIGSYSQSSNYTHVGSLPEYDSKPQPFKISGILYMSDGITPAKDYIITIHQANENGVFEVNEQRELVTSAIIKTNSKGEYVFYTYVPGTDRRYNKLQEIFMKVETPNGLEYAMPTLLFDTDEGLTKRCRKQIAKRSDASRILKLNKVNDKFEINRDMVLALNLDRIR